MKARERNIDQFFEKAQRYINGQDIDITVEQLCVEFQKALHIYKDFLQHINQDQNRKHMYRSQDKLKRRELFIKWYLQKHQDKKRIKTMLYELSDLLFTSPKTIEKQLS